MCLPCVVIYKIYCFSINNEVALQTKFPDLEGRLTFSTLMCLEQELMTIIHIGYVYPLKDSSKSYQRGIKYCQGSYSCRKLYHINLIDSLCFRNDICHSTEGLNDLAVQLDYKVGSIDSSLSSVSYHSLLEAVSDCRQYYQAR